MQLLKKLMVGVALIAAATSTQASTNATINLNTLPAGYTTFGNLQTPGSFIDTINFSLSSPSDADFGVGALNFSIGQVMYMNISNLTLSLFDSANTLLGNGLSFSVGSLAAGNYHLAVSGDANGISGGLYAGGINVTPVPEADSYLMMLAGLGLMGLIARRRRSL